MTIEPTKTGAGRGFQIALAVALTFLALGAFFAWRATTYTPAEVRRAVHLQDEGNAWRRFEARMKSPHTRADEIVALQDYLRQFPPGSPPSKREAQALAGLKALGAEPAPR